jgi:hypothetical protein
MIGEQPFASCGPMIEVFAGEKICTKIEYCAASGVMSLFIEAPGTITDILKIN